MAKPTLPKTDLTSKILDVIETALSEDAFQEPSGGPDRIEDLPHDLRDPLRVLAHGKELLSSGFSQSKSLSPWASQNELRIAARNGKSISEENWARMHVDRAGAEASFVATNENKPTDPVDLLSKEIRSEQPVESPAGGKDLEIEALAGLIAGEANPGSRVELTRIAKREGLSFSCGDYGDGFDGLLECRHNAFHIYVNALSPQALDSPRCRFTFAHELGHYFLDWHRAALSHGVPPHGSRVDFQSTDEIEREADLFAASLLLPRQAVRQKIKSRIGASEILKLAEFFGTSISATAIRCARLDLVPIIVMRWTESGRAWCWSSSAFETRTGNKAFRNIEKLPQDSVTRSLVASRDSKSGSVTSKGTTLSTWFPSVYRGSSSDDILLEECVSLGAFGVLTVLRPT